MRAGNRLVSAIWMACVLCAPLNKTSMTCAKECIFRLNTLLPGRTFRDFSFGIERSLPREKSSPSPPKNDVCLMDVSV